MPLFLTVTDQGVAALVNAADASALSAAVGSQLRAGTVAVVPVPQSAAVAANAVPQSFTTGQANNATLISRAQTALTTNDSFLALGASPTNAQVVAQVRALTKECNALIRVFLGALDDVSDT